MGRTLARLRAATGDPPLVRAGRALVPAPHAAALAEPGLARRVAAEAGRRDGMGAVPKPRAG